MKLTKSAMSKTKLQLRCLPSSMHYAFCHWRSVAWFARIAGNRECGAYVTDGWVAAISVHCHGSSCLMSKADGLRPDHLRRVRKVMLAQALRAAGAVQWVATEAAFRSPPPEWSRINFQELIAGFHITHRG
jgi:hypothetical protein